MKLTTNSELVYRAVETRPEAAKALRELFPEAFEETAEVGSYLVDSYSNRRTVLLLAEDGWLTDIRTGRRQGYFVPSKGGGVFKKSKGFEVASMEEVITAVKQRYQQKRLSHWMQES